VTFQPQGRGSRRRAKKGGERLPFDEGAFRHRSCFLIFAILLAQFNKFISVGLGAHAPWCCPTIGVLIGLMVMGQAFGVVMTGIGVIANAA
jgi:hypothetical protein